MKCPKCKGEAEYFKEVFNDGKRRHEKLVECDMCHGSGEVQMTEQEYLQTCTTEQLAEWLNNKIIICAVCDQQKNCEYFTNETCHLCPYHEGKNKSWEVWLKQPHTKE